MSKKIPNIIILEEENKILKARCAVLTKGLLCYWCQMECKSRAHDYDRNYTGDYKGEETK